MIPKLIGIIVKHICCFYGFYNYISAVDPSKVNFSSSALYEAHVTEMKDTTFMTTTFCDCCSELQLVYNEIQGTLDIYSLCIDKTSV